MITPLNLSEIRTLSLYVFFLWFQPFVQWKSHASWESVILNLEYVDARKDTKEFPATKKLPVCLIKTPGLEIATFAVIRFSVPATCIYCDNT